MSPILFSVLSALFGLALLMIVHELGHHLVARAFGMRVLRFSIGFGPTIWRHKPKGSETVYQVGVLPFLAYVQIDGMNPFEEADPNDQGSYANASLTARALTLFAGPMANYVLACVLYFATVMLTGGLHRQTTVVDVMDDGSAAKAAMHDGDKIVRIDDTEIESFEHMRELIMKSPNKKLAFGVIRDGKEHTLFVTPEPKGPKGAGLIGVAPETQLVPLSISEAVVYSLKKPIQVVQSSMEAVVKLLAFDAQGVQVSGPIRMAKEMGRSATEGLTSYLYLLAFLSASLGGLNLLPAPALDGGRLGFLAYEAAARRKPNPKFESYVHALGLLMFLALMVVVSVFDIRGY